MNSDAVGVGAREVEAVKVHLLSGDSRCMDDEVLRSVPAAFGETFHVKKSANVVPRHYRELLRENARV